MRMATATKRWTLAEVHSLPDDGNKYELVRGELFVTPPPNIGHELISARLTRLLDPFAEAHGLGYVFHPRAVLRFDQSEVEPDLMVRHGPTPTAPSWDNAPTPSLVVEIHSGSTRRRDRLQKRSLYMDAGVPEYWMVDPERRVVTVVRAGQPDAVTGSALVWSPAGTDASLAIDVATLFD